VRVNSRPHCNCFICMAAKKSSHLSWHKTSRSTVTKIPNALKYYLVFPAGKGNWALERSDLGCSSSEPCAPQTALSGSPLHTSRFKVFRLPNPGWERTGLSISVFMDREKELFRLKDIPLTQQPTALNYAPTHT